MTTITVLLYFLLLSLPSPFAISEEEKYSTTCSVTLIIVGQTISRNWTAMLLNGLRRKSRVSSGNYASALLTPWPSMPSSIFIREKNHPSLFPKLPSCANLRQFSARLSPPRCRWSWISRIQNHKSRVLRFVFNAVFAIVVRYRIFLSTIERNRWKNSNRYCHRRPEIFILISIQRIYRSFLGNDWKMKR